MQGWQDPEPGPSPHSSQPFCLSLVSPHTQHFNVIFYDLAVGLPTIVFVAYLLTKVKGSVRKLVGSRSHIMSTYYGFLWIVCALNILRVLVQVGFEPMPSCKCQIGTQVIQLYSSNAVTFHKSGL
jgi:hypothetical protein